MDCRERAGVTGIQELQQVECLAGPDLTQDDSVWAVTKRSLQKIADRYGWDAALLAARFEPDEIRLKQVQFRGVFDEDDPLVLGNESRKRRRERGLTAAGTAADQERLLSQDIVFETVGKLAVKRSDANQVLHIEVA